MLNYACNNTNYYSNFLKNGMCSVDDIKSFPFLTKKIIRDNFDDLKSNELDKLHYSSSYTGGSTGEPLHFYHKKNMIDPIFQAKYWRYLGFKLGDVILAMDGTSVSQNNIDNNIFYGKKKSVFSLPYGKYFLSSLYLNEDNIHMYVDYICKLKPDFIRGYPSFIYQISKYIYDNNIKIDFKIKAIQLTSESSFPYQWDIISKAFNTKVCGQYGHTEACIFAYTYDDSMKYIVEPLYGHVEVLNDDNTDTAEEDVGEVVVTSFYNKAMPLIRYRTGDYALVGKRDGSTLILDKIMGRTQDYIYNRAGEKVLLTTLIFAQHFKALGNISKWQIIQDKIGEVNMKIIKGSNYTLEDENEIKTLFDSKADTDVKFEYVDAIRTTKRGKSKLLVQNISD